MGESDFMAASKALASEGIPEVTITLLLSPHPGRPHRYLSLAGCTFELQSGPGWHSLPSARLPEQKTNHGVDEPPLRFLLPLRGGAAGDILFPILGISNPHKKNAKNSLISA